MRFLFVINSPTLSFSLINADSEDSDGEGGLGNVSRVVIRPPGHSGKAKRGHLCFDAAFETGNLGRADLVGEFEYDLFLRPDTCNPRYRFWFNFTVDNVKLDQRVIFNIVNMSKQKNLFRDGLTPLVKSSSRPKWQRVPKSNVFYYKSSAHQDHYVLSFSFAFDKEDEVYQFALAPPYSYSRLQTYLGMLESKFPDKRFTREALTKSVQNRRLELITIDHVRKPDKVDPKHKIRVIFVLARAHAGASPASFVVQGLLEFLIGNHPIAKLLRERFVFKILPMMNPDGVFLGNNRCNLFGQDLNRTWNIATEYLQPTLFETKKLFREYDQSDVSDGGQRIPGIQLNVSSSSPSRLIKWTLSLTSMPTLVCSGHSSTGIPTKMSTGMSDILSSLNCCRPTPMTGLMST